MGVSVRCVAEPCCAGWCGAELARGSTSHVLVTGAGTRGSGAGASRQFTWRELPLRELAVAREGEDVDR